MSHRLHNFLHELRCSDCRRSWQSAWWRFVGDPRGFEPLPVMRAPEDLPEWQPVLDRHIHELVMGKEYVRKLVEEGAHDDD